MKKLFLMLFALMILGLTFGCNNETTEELKYTVSFETGGGTEIANQEILNGGKVTKPADPTREGYIFSGKWFKGNFEWNFNIDIVTEDIVLVAEWVEISSTPTNIKLTEEIFSSTLTWQQTDADLQSFTVSVRPSVGGSYTVLAGTITVDNSGVLDTVTFTPSTVPTGGYFVVKVQAGSEMALSEPLLLGGAGTVANPYRVSKVSEILALLDDDTLANKNFLQVEDVLMTLTDPIEINNERKVVFSGVYDGGGKSLSFGGNGGLFHEISATGVVKNLVIDSTTQLSAQETNLYPIGAIADTNNGLIENIDSRAQLTNSRMQGDLPVFTGTVDTTDLSTGAGGIVGINGQTGIIRNVNVGGAGAVKAGRGVGGVSAYNFGLIEQATVTATLPAGNQANSAKSSNTYSFGGGITGFNFGTIRESVVSGRVFAQSAYSTSGDGNEGKNVAFGGIAGYNEGLITECSFARSLSSKEFIDKSRAEDLGDSANNLGVGSIHGDIYVGGIAGINAGDITYTYVGGALIAARDYVGGVAGLTLGSGSISNTYVFAEIAIKDDGGLKITAANNKTTLTTYEIAPSGFDATTVFFRNLLNSSTGNSWTPGDSVAPSLPNFLAEDLTKLGNKFSENGVLLWQQGSVTGVEITLDNMVLPHGTIQAIDFVVLPANAPDTYTIWTSSDDSIVEIVGEGIVKGVGAGEATITVTTRDGGFTDTLTVTVEDYVKIESVVVTADVLTLPEANNADDRLDVEIGTVVVFSVDILPINADYQNYALSASNSRAEVDGNTVTFVYGNTGPGRVSIVVTFEDTSVAPLEYRFETKQESNPVEIPITDVTISSPEITLPEPNNSEVRDNIEIGSVINIVVSDILPVNASNTNYTISLSNSRGSVNGNEVTFTALGLISIYVDFEDVTIGDNGRFNFRFTIVEGEPAEVPITNVTITSPEITLPEANNAEIRPEIEIGTSITIVVSDILPIDASNQNYTITSSNSRAEVDGNTITFVYGNTGPGNVSVIVTFEDTSVGPFEYRFLTTQPVQDVPIDSVSVTSDEFTLPEANNPDIRPEIEIGTVVVFDVAILPLNATNQNYTLTSSNSRAEVSGNTVTFVYGLTGPGSVSITVTFEDSNVSPLEYRFATIEAPVEISIDTVTVTSPEMTLPEANNPDVRPEVEIGTVINFVIDILPTDATNQNYTLTSSNSRAEVSGNTVSFVYGLTGPGKVSITVTFEDTTVAPLEYRFMTIPAPVIITADATASEITLGAKNVVEDKVLIDIDTVITFVITFSPSDPTDMSYTITASNSRAVVDGNTVTFVFGNTGPGNVSLTFTFTDSTISPITYYFTTQSAAE